jgi:hypothetical protein
VALIDPPTHLWISHFFKAKAPPRGGAFIDHSPQNAQMLQKFAITRMRFEINNSTETTQNLHVDQKGPSFPKIPYFYACF